MGIENHFDKIVYDYLKNIRTKEDWAFSVERNFILPLKLYKKIKMKLSNTILYCYKVGDIIGYTIYYGDKHIYTSCNKGGKIKRIYADIDKYPIRYTNSFLRELMRGEYGSYLPRIDFLLSIFHGQLSFMSKYKKMKVIATRNLSGIIKDKDDIIRLQKNGRKRKKFYYDVEWVDNYEHFKKILKIMMK